MKRRKEDGERSKQKQIKMRRKNTNINSDTFDCVIRLVYVFIPSNAQYESPNV